MPGTINSYSTLTSAIGDWTHRSDLTSGSPPYSDYLIQAAQEQFEKDIFDLNFGNGIRFQEAAYAPSFITGGTLPVPSDWLAPKLLTVSDGGGNVGPLIFKAAAWIYDNYPNRQASNVPAYIARDVQPAASFTASLTDAGVLAVTALASGILFPGMVLADTTSDLPAATPGSAVIITGQSSGTTGSTGNYTAASISPLAPTYTVDSEAMTAGGDVFVFGPVADSAYQVGGTYYQSAPLLSASGASTNWMVKYAPMTLLAYCLCAAATFLKDAAMLATWTPVAQAGAKGLVDKDKAERWGNSTLQVETA